MVRGLPTSASIGHAESAQRSELLLPPISFYLGPSRLTPKSSLGEFWGCGVSRRLLIVRDEQKMSKRHDADGRAVPPAAWDLAGSCEYACQAYWQVTMVCSGLTATHRAPHGHAAYSAGLQGAQSRHPLTRLCQHSINAQAMQATCRSLSSCPLSARCLPAVCPLSACGQRPHRLRSMQERSLRLDPELDLEHPGTLI